MKKAILGLGLVLALTGAAFAQRTDTKAATDVENKTAVSKNGKNLSLESGTQIAAQLENSLDVKKAKIGDQVVLKTTKAIKQNGKTVVDKGSRLIGRVTEVQQKSGGSAASKVGVLFDRLENGGQQLPVNAVITSITQARANTRVDDTLDSDVSGSSTTRAATQSLGGGLLGGVGNTVGGVANTATNTVGGATETVGSTVGNTTRTVGGTLRGIQVTQSTDASAEGGSLLSLQGGDLKLEKGTTFNLNLSSSTSVER